MPVMEILGQAIFWGLMLGVFLACVIAPVAIAVWLFDTTKPKK